MASLMSWPSFVQPDALMPGLGQRRVVLLCDAERSNLIVVSSSARRRLINSPGWSGAEPRCRCSKIVRGVWGGQEDQSFWTAGFPRPFVLPKKKGESKLPPHLPKPAKTQKRAQFRPVSKTPATLCGRQPPFVETSCLRLAFFRSALR